MSALSPIQQHTLLFSINQNITWTIRPLVYETIDPATKCTFLKILKIVWFYIAGLNKNNFATSYTYLEQAAQQTGRQVAHLFILLSCKIDIVCVWISNMDSIEICFQGFTNDVVGLNESIFYCQRILWKKFYHTYSLHCAYFGF